jgi:TetR/AcrR family transcriptional regulator, cholesterol catabolism regulator
MASSAQPGVERARTPSRSRRAGNDQEARMIDAAAQMFYERGYDATSIQEVADELGLLKGSLYHYINSKDDLLWEIILRQHRSALALAERSREFDGTPREKLRAFVLGYVESLEKEHVYVSVYLHDINRLSVDRRSKVTGERKAITDLIVQLLEEGAAAGEFYPDMDARLTANAILGMLNSAYRWYRPGSRTASPKAVVNACLSLIMRGVSVEPDET